MRIDSSSIFTFYFPYEGHEIAIPVRAQTQDEAITKLRGFFVGWGNELLGHGQLIPSGVAAGSGVAPKAAAEEIGILGNPNTNAMMLELRIEDLVKEVMPLKKVTGAQPLQNLIKKWTGFPYEPQNYAAIISELEAIKINNESKN